MLSAPSAGRGFSPLDDELALLPGAVTPSLVESMVRLGTWMPFYPAAKMLGHFTKVDISAATARKTTEKAGQAYVAVQTAQLEVLQKELPEAPAGPPVQQVSVDGAMVPLLHKEWAEVKTLAIGEVTLSTTKDGKTETHTQDLSYFSRLADHETFTYQATVEMHRRGTEKAGLVCAVVDGAEWEQTFIDLHCPDAVRILDWGHASGYVAKSAQAVFGAGTQATSQWLEVQLHELMHGDPQKVLGELRALRDQLAGQAEGETPSEVWKTVNGSLEYLEKRQEQIRYAEFLAAGYPIGSGIVESANKLVVEARLKGAGMHWARKHVDPMVALRTVACSDRWEEAWPQICERLRRRPKNCPSVNEKPMAQVKVAVADSNEIAVRGIEQPSPVVLAKPKPAMAKAGGSQLSDSTKRPAANHPWRRMRIGRGIPFNAKRSNSTET